MLTKQQLPIALYHLSTHRSTSYLSMNLITLSKIIQYLSFCDPYFTYYIGLQALPMM